MMNEPLARVELRLFGSPRLLVSGHPVEMDTRKAVALLAYLAVTGGVHQRDALAGLFWPDYDQSSARAALRRTLATLNRATEDPKGLSLLDITRDSLAVSPSADLWFDVKAFHAALDATSRHGHPGGEVCALCIKPLEEAAALYPEPFMAGFALRDSPNFDEWQFFQEETLRPSLSTALEKLLMALPMLARTEDAVAYARRWLALDPLAEDAHRALMALYAQADQRSAALRQYRECVRILDEELGVAPLDETTALYESILNRQPLPAAQGRFRWVEGRPQAPAPAGEAVQPPTFEENPAGAPRTAGRSLERQELAQAYRRARGGAVVAAITGEAGIGKTHLAEAFLEEARRGGARVIRASCYQGEASMAYAPLVDGLSSAVQPGTPLESLRALAEGTRIEASRLLPDLRPPGAPPPTDMGEGSQARFFDALRAVIEALLAGVEPGVLFLDDLQWADSATLDFITYLARRSRAAPVLILTAWRPEPGEATGRLERLMIELKRSRGAVSMQLGRLNLDEMRALVEQLGRAGSEAEKVARRLMDESEGVPFIAVEYLSALSEGQDGESAWAMPAGVRGLLKSRIESVDPAARQLLSAAAVIGRSFDFHLLREASGRSDVETVDGLDRLAAAGLLVEQGSGEPGSAIRYDFTQEKLRALAYEETSLARRFLLHRRVAESLARQPRARTETPGLLAHHYERAGMKAEAAEHHGLAGERARSLFANVEALGHFQTALAMGHPDVAGIHEAIGDLHTLMGRYPAAADSYLAAQAACSPGCIARLEHKLGSVYQRAGQYDRAESHYRASLDTLAEAENPALRSRLLADLSLAAHARGDDTSARDLASQALALAEPLGEPGALAQVFNLLGMLARARGDAPTAAGYLERSLRAAESLDDPLAQIAALNNLALLYGEGGDSGRAIPFARQALDLCRRRGDRHREAALHNNLADLFHQAGREAEAMEELKQAVVIFAEIGGADEDALPSKTKAEIWKLTEW